MSVSGFTLLHAGGYEPGGRLGQITDVSFGHATDYALVIKIEQATKQLHLTFVHPLSFRVQDERDLMDY